MHDVDFDVDDVDSTVFSVVDVVFFDGLGFIVDVGVFIVDGVEFYGVVSFNDENFVDENVGFIDVVFSVNDGDSNTCLDFFVDLVFCLDD